MLALYDKVSRGWLTTVYGGYFTQKAGRSVFSDQSSLDQAIEVYKNKMAKMGLSKESIALSSSFWVTKKVL